MPTKYGYERGSILKSSVKMDRQNSTGKKIKKGKNFRSISKSLILCNTKNSDDGSSVEEKYSEINEISQYSMQDWESPFSGIPQNDNMIPEPTKKKMVLSRNTSNDKCLNKSSLKVNVSLISNCAQAMDAEILFIHNKQ